MPEEMSRRSFQKGTGWTSRAAVVAMVLFGLLVLLPFGILVVNWLG